MRISIICTEQIMYVYASSQCNNHFAYGNYVKPQSSLILAHRGEHEFNFLSQHITNIFRKTYNADIVVTYACLLGFMNAQDKPLAALGIRYAAEESPLFLERYLDKPVDVCLQAITGERIARHTIAEAGNLASSGKADILMLLYGLACHLDHEGISTILFTGTALLKRYLHSLGLYPHVLAEADPARLGEDAARWGTYYATRPKVMAGNVLAFRKGLEAYFCSLGKKA
jgi:hypothetical protein